MGYAISGVHFVPLTPFTADGAIDVPGLRRLIRRVMAGGCEGVITGGLVSQIQFLDEAERRLIVRVALKEAAGRYPVSHSIEGPTDRAIGEALEAKAAGVQALMLHPPLVDFMDPSNAYRFLYEHYRAIADAADLPIILFEFPRSHPAFLPPERFARLCCEIEQAVAYKAGNALGADFARTYRLVKEQRPAIAVLGAVGHDIVPAAINGGIDGMTAGFAAVVTEPLVETFRAVQVGDWATAVRLHKTILQPVGEAIYGWPALDAWFHVRYKYAAWLLGRVERPEPRRPWLPLPDEEIARLRAVLEQTGLLALEQDIVAGLSADEPVAIS
jgi:4-hydroxy-tetrahydrodipicolinate synthase